MVYNTASNIRDITLHCDHWIVLPESFRDVDGFVEFVNDDAKLAVKVKFKVKVEVKDVCRQRVSDS